MQRFTGDETCPKCNSPVRPGRAYVDQRDTIRLVCPMCQYEWEVLPADATPPETPAAPEAPATPVEE